MSNHLEEVERMMSDCDERSTDLNFDDFQFINSICAYTEQGGFLSERQEARLLQIWHKVML
jgi:hypothetical protein